MVPQGAENKAVSEVVQAMAAEAGFDMKIRVTEFATSLKTAEQGDYQAYFIGWSGRTDPDGNIYIFEKTKAPQNVTGFSNPEVDKALDDARLTSDSAKRKAIYEKAAKILLADNPILYLYHRKVLIAQTTKIDGFVPVPDGLVRVVGLRLSDSRRGGQSVRAPCSAGTRLRLPPTGTRDAHLPRQAHLQLIPTLFFVSVLIFSLQHLLPGDPALIMAGEDRDPAVIEQIRKQYRLDQPLPVQYVYWVKGVLSGDLGESIRNKQRVLDLVLQKLPVTMQLAAMAIVIALVDRHHGGHRLGGLSRHAAGTMRPTCSRCGGCRRRTSGSAS